MDETRRRRKLFNGYFALETGFYRPDLDCSLGSHLRVGQLLHAFAARDGAGKNAGIVECGPNHVGACGNGVLPFEIHGIDPCFGALPDTGYPMPGVGHFPALGAKGRSSPIITFMLILANYRGVGEIGR